MEQPVQKVQKWNGMVNKETF